MNKRETRDNRCEQGSETHIKEDNIPVGVSIVQVNTVKTLWELDIAALLSISRVHHETHGFFNSLAVVEVMITIDVQKKCSIGKNSRNTDLSM